MFTGGTMRTIKGIECIDIEKNRTDELGSGGEKARASQPSRPPSPMLYFLFGAWKQCNIGIDCLQKLPIGGRSKKYGTYKIGQVNQKRAKKIVQKEQHDTARYEERGANHKKGSNPPAQQIRTNGKEQGELPHPFSHDHFILVKLQILQASTKSP